MFEITEIYYCRKESALSRMIIFVFFVYLSTFIISGMVVSDDAQQTAVAKPTA
jgi:hypothetical protein